MYAKIVFSSPSYLLFKMHLIFVYIYAAVYLTEIIIPGINVNAASSTPVSTGRALNEDIRDAVTSLTFMLRDNLDKLERHEARERYLGDELQKTLSSIEKKQQKSEESSQLTETLNAINRRLESVESALAKMSSPSVSDNSIKFQQSIENKIGNIEENIQRNELVIESIRSNLTQKLELIVSNVLQSEKAISALDQKFIQAITTRNEALINLETKLTHVESLQNKLIDETTNIRRSAGQYAARENGSCQVPYSLIQKLDELQNEISRQNDTGRCREETEKTHSLIKQYHQTISSVISERKTLNMSDENENADKKYDELLKQFKHLSKIEQVLIQTADNVLDTKRRIEYGTHQVLKEIGEMIKSSSKESNETVNRRFDTISMEILGSTNGALQNLSSKLETEISQVWRQIGIMYQILTNSADSLDKLQQQTEIYVNGSLSTMDNMQGKVGLITNRMSEVDENLNYLLGRLSLVTQEFNQIKVGLGEALDNIRKSFHSVQDKVKDVGPGPNPIEEESISVVTPLQKTAKIAID